MELSVEHVGNVIVVRLCVESLTANNSNTFRSELAHVIEPQARIVLDLSSLYFIDSSGIGALISLISKAQRMGGSVKICRVTRQVRNLLELVRADRFLRVFDVVEDAVRSFAEEEDVA